MSTILSLLLPRTHPLPSNYRNRISMRTPKQKLDRTIAQIKRRNTLEGRLRSILANARSHSKQREHDAPSITLDDLLALWDKQEGRCAYTGWTMDTISHSPYLVSAERVNNRDGYTVDNVVLVCWSANNARGSMTTQDFISLCNAVHDNLLGIQQENTTSEPTISPVIAWTSRALCPKTSENLPVSDWSAHIVDALLLAVSKQ